MWLLPSVFCIAALAPVPTIRYDALVFAIPISLGRKLDFAQELGQTSMQLLTCLWWSYLFECILSEEWKNNWALIIVDGVLYKKRKYCYIALFSVFLLWFFHALFVFYLHLLNWTVTSIFVELHFFILSPPSLLCAAGHQKIVAIEIQPST